MLIKKEILLFLTKNFFSQMLIGKIDDQHLAKNYYFNTIFSIAI